MHKTARVESDTCESYHLASGEMTRGVGACCRPVSQFWTSTLTSRPLPLEWRRGQIASKQLTPALKGVLTKSGIFKRIWHWSPATCGASFFRAAAR